MSVTVFFVRHAPHDQLGRVLCGRSPGVTLGEAGRGQAAAVAAHLAAEAIQAVYSSPLDRARETAGPIAALTGATTEVSEDLNEVNFGLWNGAAFEDLAADPEWVRWNHERDTARPPGGESMGEVQARLRGWLCRMRVRHGGQRIAAVSHADVIKAALADALGLTLQRHDRFEISPASISVLVAGDWGAKVHSINEAPR